LCCRLVSCDIANLFTSFQVKVWRNLFTLDPRMNLDLKNQNDQYDPPAFKKASSSGCGKGCLVVTLICVAILLIGGTYIALNYRSLGARLVSYVVKKTIEQSDLPADQKQALITRVEKLRTDFIDGKITDEQLERIGKELVEGPLLPVGMVLFIEQQHVTPSGLSDDEKKAAHLTLQRLARGVIEKKIDYAKLDPMFAVISTTDSEGKKELKKKITDTEMRDFLTLAQREVDAAKIPEEPLQIDLAKEFDAAIERAMQEPIEKPF